jgi:hypothetical protein
LLARCVRLEELCQPREGVHRAPWIQLGAILDLGEEPADVIVITLEAFEDSDSRLLLHVSTSRSSN